MHNYYDKNASILTFAKPSTKIFVLGILLEIVSIILSILKRLLQIISEELFKDITKIEPVSHFLDSILKTCVCIGIICLIIAVIVHIRMTDTQKICLLIKKCLFSYQYGNPLHLKDHERLPKVSCKNIGLGVFVATISATCCTVEDIQNVASSISSGLNKKFSQYAITQSNTDVAFNTVSFRIEDVTVDRTLVVHDAAELYSGVPTKLRIDMENCIDLTTSGSMLFCGKTRSGKTTGTISILMQALLAGRDVYCSEILIIDPKQAELSRLPHVVTLDENGDATEILKAMKHFADTVTARQKVLNELSEKEGDAVHWYDREVVNMHVSLIFIDEYVACRSIFPKKASKEEPDYCLSTFDALLKRLVTMGASTGSYVIISIAEASVDESGGGLPAMLRSACTTKILFKPTLVEGRLLWNSDKLQEFNNGRIYNAGDSWFSSTDSVHDNVSYVHFPVMEFPVYRILGELLSAYYA